MCSIPGLPISGSEVPVRIIRVNQNPNCGLVELWVNMDDGRKHIYEQMSEEIQIPNRKFKESEGKPGDLCLVCISGTWHRARIVLIQIETYNVFLIDQGQHHITTSEALAWGPSDIFLLPPEIESCILANVVSLENHWPEKATKFLKSLPGKKIKGLVQHVLMPDRIIILDIPIVVKHMCKFGVAKKMPVDEFKCHALECLQLPKGERSEAILTTVKQNLKVSCQLEKHDQYLYPELLTDTFEKVYVTEVTNPQNFFCKLQIFSKAVKILSEQIHQHYEESSKVSALGEAQPQTSGDPCAARGIDGRWHRSLLKQNMSSDGAVEVLHVDEGKTEFVPAGDIKPLHGKFMRMPVVTYPCSLEGVKDDGTGWTTDQTDCLKSLILSGTVAKFDYHDISQDIYYVTLCTAHGACINDCFREKPGLFPPSETEIDSNVQNEAIPSSFPSSPGDEQCVDVQNKVDTNGHGLQEESSTSTNKLAVNGRMSDLPTSGTDDIQIKKNSGNLDLVIQSNGHLSDFHSKVQNDDDLFTVGNGVNVKVSYVESLHKFWCQTTENGDSLRLLMQDMQNHYASGHPQPLVESICVARNPDDGIWYRARIMATHNSPLVDVSFIDYGQTLKVPLRDVRRIDPDFLRLNAQAFQCCLFNLKNPTNPTAVAWTDSALAKFRNIVDLSASPNIGLKCIIKSVSSDDEGMPLTVVDIETPSDSVCTILAQECELAEAYKQIPPHVPLDAYNYCTHDIEVGGKEIVWVKSLENINHFYCQLERNSHLFDTVMEQVKQLMDQRQITDHPPGLNGICFAKYIDNLWYRGQIVEMSPKLKVHFVDNGQTLAVNESDICPFPTEASIGRSVPVQAVPLGLFNVPAEVPQEVNQWFADHVIGHSVTISVVAKGPKGKLIVELLNGSLNVNVEVRERISKLTQQKKTGLIQQTDQQVCIGVPNEDFLMQELRKGSKVTKRTEEKVHSTNGMCAKDELRIHLQSITNVSVPEVEHRITLNEPTLDAILEDKETSLAETFIQDDKSDPEMTQHSLVSSPDENVNILMYKRPNISLNKTEEVYASCIVEPHHFWCQYTNTEDLNMVSKLAQEVEQAQQDLIFPQTLVPGSPCFALFSSDNQWYRAQVIQKTENTLHVLFIDYGNETDVDIKNVRPLPQSLLEKAPQAFLCSLKGFDKSKGSWKDEVYDDFDSLLVDKPLKLTVFNVEDHAECAVPQYAVEIWCDGVNVNSSMQKYWKPVSKECVTKESPQTETSLKDCQTESNLMHISVSKGNVNTCKYKEPDISKNKTEMVYASCIVEPHYLWCQYANAQELNHVSSLAQEAGQAQQDTKFPQTLGPGSPCLALFSSDNQWYRAQVTHRADDEFHVIFIDYGNETDVDIKNVRQLPQSLLEKAPQAFLCSLKGFDKSKGSWKDEVYDDFYSLLVDKPLKLTVFNMENHSEIAVPQYAVQIKCDGVDVSSEMQKYWEPVAKECVGKENPQTASAQDCQTESNMMHISVSKGNVNTCVFKEPDISKNKTEMVYASSIVEPHYFWCQYVNTEMLNQVSKLAQEAGQAQQDTMFPKTLGPGSPCLALFSSDNQWYRAKVTQRADDEFHVIFIDYGNESDVNVMNVRRLPQSLLEKAPQAFLCSLKGFDKSKGSWKDEVYDDFYSLLVDKPLKLTVFNMEDHSEIAVPQYAVQIKCDGVDVTSAMQKYWEPVAKECVTKENPQTEVSVQDLQTVSNMINIIDSKGNVNTCVFKEPGISKNKTEMVYASCIVEPHYFWCQYANTWDLNQVSKLAQEAGQAQQDTMFPQTLGPGSPCLALFSSDNQWYRAQVTHRADDDFNVIFIDYGNETDVNIKNVRRLPQSLLKKAPLALLCSLKGFDKSKGTWKDEVYDDFNSLLVDKPLKLTVFDMEDHAEIAVPQYAVEIECGGVVVNTLMEKYWKGLDKDHALEEVQRDREEC